MMSIVTVTGFQRKAGAEHMLSTRRVSMGFLCISMFTLSWDVIGNIDTSLFNIKIQTLAQALALATSVLDPRIRRLTKLEGILLALGMAMIAWQVLSALVSVDVTTGLLQTFRNLSAAFLPFIAVLAVVQTQSDLIASLTWFIRGMVVAAIFGFYQLTAFYTGLPQLIEYSGLSGGLGRISSFSYEPAYFGHFLLFALAATVARSQICQRRLPIFPTSIVVLAIFLTNARVLLLTVPLFLIMIVVRQGTSRVRKYVIGLAVILIGVMLLLNQLFPQVGDFFSRQFSSIGDSENASNDDRLNQYDRNIAVINSSDWLIGVGPGNLINYLPSVSETATSTSTVANNMWLQAMLDGGLPLAVLQGVVVLIVVVVWLRVQTTPAAQTLSASWLPNILIGGSLVSIFFTPHVWTFLALTVVVNQLAPSLMNTSTGASVDESSSE